MTLHDMTLEDILSKVGRTSPAICGSTTCLIAAQLGIAMARMALLVSAARGRDTALSVTLLDSIAADIATAAERDRAAAAAMIDATRQDIGMDQLGAATIDATREPLTAAHLIVEATELLETCAADIDHSVASDFFGGVSLVSGAFSSTMMAVNLNFENEAMAGLRSRTAAERTRLADRHAAASGRLHKLAEVLAIWA